jgi:16S rRNA (cytosine967-C5)-methyltransferase
MNPERDRRPSRPQRGRPAPRKQGPRRPPPDDPARRAALDVLRAVRERDAYANLVLPDLLRERRITGRDAALATELTYGAARAQGLVDEVIGACLDRPLSKVDGMVLDCLRLGTYQLLRTRIPEHAAVDGMVNLARADAGSHVAGFVNAVLRKVSEHDEATWLEQLAPDRDADPIGNLALHTAHPRWVARSFAEALGDKGPELEAALKADDARPEVHLVARPGEISADELAAITGGEVAPYSPYGVPPTPSPSGRGWRRCRTRAASCAPSPLPGCRSRAPTSAGSTCAPARAARPRCSARLRACPEPRSMRWSRPRTARAWSRRPPKASRSPCTSPTGAIRA